MRIGIFGGSFDPVHYGHLLLAEMCREQCELDEVRLVPAAIPPHKQGKGRAADEHRLEMLNLAVGGHQSIVAWDVELQRGGVSYTIDTLRTLRAEQPEDELFFLMGADSLFDLPSWREPREICEIASIVVVNRPGSADVDFSVLDDIIPAERQAVLQRLVVNMPQMGISSTEIRDRIATGRSIRFQTPRAVEQFIEAASLYTDS